MTFKKSILAMLLPLAIAGCNSSESDSVNIGEDLDTGTGNEIELVERVTAPTLNVEIQSAYKQKTTRYAYQRNNDAQWEFAIQRYKQALEEYDVLANNLYMQPKSENGSYPGYEELAFYDENETYAKAGSIVKYSDGNRHGVFTNKWWTRGNIPDFDDKSGPWQLVTQVGSDGDNLSPEELINAWKSGIAYVAGDVVKFVIDAVEYYFEAKYWNTSEPILTASSGLSDVADWESPWKFIGTTGEGVPEVDNGNSGNNGGDNGNGNVIDPDDILKPPACEVGNIEVADNCYNINDLEVITPVLPPVTPWPDETVDPEEITPPPSIETGDDGLPAEGYEFLRELTTEHWDWLFPMRSGRYNPAGGTRNMPPIALEDGSTDTFSLASFKAAVMEYNTWAKSKGYKEFLNEGTKSQQALEFVAFWAKSARETSGSWNNAPAPWIVDDADAGTVWKGGLYWVEEVGYTTDENGMSSAINYVDHGSSYAPYPNRSYYGRGIIQLSWNYNYGAFSEWLYNNGMMRDLITSKETLLARPDYVATNGTLSILSGIWFWMTPQGAKPASQDVILGDVTNVSAFSQDMGLPQRNDNGYIPTAEGESTDEAVIAYRLGTIINIVNGGLECNRAAAWHPGPMQRVSYYNAFAKYFNAKINGVDVTTVKDATNVWDHKVSASSPDNLKTATCYAQKSYYGW